MSINIDELIEAVNIAFDNIVTKTLGNLFISLQQILLKIMKIDGYNDLKPTHIKKEKLLSQRVYNAGKKDNNWW